MFFCYMICLPVLTRIGAIRLNYDEKKTREMHEPLLDSSKTVIHGSYTMNEKGWSMESWWGMSGLHTKIESRLHYRRDPVSRDDR
jgi:hypothetical protein